MADNAVNIVLSTLGRTTLKRLLFNRCLPASQENEQRRVTLSHWYGDRLALLIQDLLRPELISIFNELTFECERAQMFLPSPYHYRRDDLANMLFGALEGRFTTNFEPIDEEDWDEDDEEEEKEGNEEEEEENDDDEEDDDEEDASDARSLLDIHSNEWSRPRIIGRIFARLSLGVPRRLHTPRFQDLLHILDKAGIEACMSDNNRILSLKEESPGIDTKLRLRLKVVPKSVVAESSNHVRAPDPVVKKPEPVVQNVVMPTKVSDYNLAALRMQFLTAVPSPGRKTSAAWPVKFLEAATAGLSLRPNEMMLLKAYAAGLTPGNHNPFDAIDALKGLVDWTILLEDFSHLNKEHPELVEAIVDHIQLTTDKNTPETNQRELGALADMFE
jgi:hypothetical protein